MNGEERWWKLDRSIQNEINKLTTKRNELYDEWKEGKPTKERLQVIKTHIDIIDNQLIVYNRVDGMMEGLEETK